MLRSAASFVAVVLLVGAAPVVAQPWAGAAAVGVEVRAAGDPVRGAQVELFFLADPQHAGPGPVTTDDEGEARVYGLAEGRWFVRVRHPDYLTYEAEVDVARSGKPREGMVARRKEGSSLQTNKVRFFKVDGGTSAADRPRPDRPSESPPMSRPPTPATAASAAEPERTTGERAASIEPPGPAPETPTTPASVAAPAAAVISPDRSSGPRTLRSPHDGSCFDCQPGEWAASAYGVERPGRPDGEPCPRLRDLAAELVAQLGDLGGYAGPLQDSQTGDPILSLGSSTAATLERLLEPFAEERCQVLAVRLPPGAQFRGFQLEAIDEDGPVPCQPGAECPSGECAWTVPPIVERSATGTIVMAGFENRSATRSRQPRLTIYFVPRSDWRPVM